METSNMFLLELWFYIYKAIKKCGRIAKVHEYATSILTGFKFCFNRDEIKLSKL
jgi:hypothetical protein